MTSNSSYLHSHSWAPAGSAWRWFDDCPRCLAAAGGACVNRNSGEPKRSPHEDRPRLDTPLPWSPRQALDDPEQACAI